jgi:two-component system NarL family response regulator
MVKVAIIDDHAVVRMGVKYMLDVHKRDFAFAGEWPQGEGAAQFVAKADPDVVLLDIRMPDRDGLSVLEDILRMRPRQKVIMLTTSDADNDVYRALNLGAKGYLLKDRDANEIPAAIDRVMNGGKFLPEAVMELFRKRQMTPNLTPREEEVMQNLRDGLTNETIASRMGITRDSVKLHLKNIFAKFGVGDRISALREAITRGVLR